MNKLEHMLQKRGHMRDAVRVSVIGAGRCGEATLALARDVGRRLARAGCIVVCGGLGGVMRAACQGAKEAGGTTIGILPGADRHAANEFVDMPMATALGSMRNFLVVQNGDAAIAVEGETGTLSEIALALKSGRRVVALGRWSGLEGVVPAESAEEAVRLALEWVEEQKKTKDRT